MNTEIQIRDRLIDSCHSNEEADRMIEENIESDKFIEHLVVIALDEEDFGGDAPMQASYYLSKAPTALTKKREDRILRAYQNANGFQGHLALALGRMTSAIAKERIQSDLGDGTRFDAWLFRKALEYYESNGSIQSGDGQ